MAINQKLNIHELVACANIFVRKDDKYLLLKRSSLKQYSPNVIHPIGGKIDPNEDPYTAAQRELFEELGVTVKHMRLEAVIMEIKPVPDEPYNWLIFHFSADYDSGNISSTEEGELIWLTRDEILNEPLVPSLRQTIGHILNSKEGMVFARIPYDDKGNAIEEGKIINVCEV